MTPEPAPPGPDYCHSISPEKLAQLRSSIEGECIHGHARTPENVYRNPRGIVSCRPCHTKWSREWKQSHAS